jgi:hypothetical protein
VSAKSVVYAVAWQEGTVLLATEGAFAIVALDPDATIDDTLGAIRGRCVSRRVTSWRTGPNCSGAG